MKSSAQIMSLFWVRCNLVSICFSFERVFNCSALVLGLYKLIKKKFSSLMSPSRINIRSSLSDSLFLIKNLLEPMKQIKTPNELDLPCELRTSPLKSSFPLISSLTVEWVSWRKKKPLETILSLKYLMSFNLLLVDWKPFLLLEIKLIYWPLILTQLIVKWYNWEIEVSILLQSKFANCKHKRIAILRDKKWTNWFFD